MRRVVALMSVGALVAAAAPAVAASQASTACRLVSDRQGDAFWNPASYSPVFPAGSSDSDEAMDITSVDIATNAHLITGVLRIKKLSPTSAHAPEGMTWRVGFTVGSFTFTLAGHVNAAGTPDFDASYSALGGSADYGPSALGIVDSARSEVRISIPRSVLAPQANIKPGTLIRDVTGEAAQETRVRSPQRAWSFASRHTVDVAAGGSDYVAGRKSCVTVGG